MSVLKSLQSSACCKTGLVGSSPLPFCFESPAHKQPTKIILCSISSKLSNWPAVTLSAERIRFFGLHLSAVSAILYSNTFIQTSCLIYIQHHQLISICSHHMQHPPSALPKDWRYTFSILEVYNFWNFPGISPIFKTTVG